MSYISDLTRPSEVKHLEIAEKKSNKLTSKPDVIITDNIKGKELINDLLIRSNWELQRTKIHSKKSIHGGVCIFLNQINNEWLLQHTTQVIRVMRDAALNEKVITMLVTIISGNSGKYYLYQTHIPGKIIRSVRKVEEDKDGNDISADESFDNDEYPWMSFLADANYNLKQVVNIPNNTMTAHILINKPGEEDNYIFGLSDVEVAKQQIEILDVAFESLAYTLRAARTRLVIRKTQGSTIQDLEGQELEGDEFMDGGVVIIQDRSGYPDAPSPLSVSDPNPQAIEYAWKAYEKADIQVYTRVGLANPDDSDGAQKSEFEVSQIRDSEHSSLEKDIQLAQSVLKKVLEAIGAVLGIDLGKEYGWEITRLDVKEETNMVENLERMYNNGWQTLVNTIAKANNIDPTDAAALLKEIDKEKEERKPDEIKEDDEEEIDKTNENIKPGVDNNAKTE